MRQETRLVSFEPVADRKHFVCYYPCPCVVPGGKEFKAFPVVQLNPLFGTTYNVEVLLLFEHSPARLVPYDLVMSGSLNGMRSHQLTLTDPANLERLDEALKDLTNNSVCYALYGDTSNNRVEIVREEIAAEEPAARTAVITLDAGNKLLACVQRGHHLLVGHIVLNDIGKPDYHVGMCRDCHMIAELERP